MIKMNKSMLSSFVCTPDVNDEEKLYVEQFKDKKQPYYSYCWFK